MLQAIPYTHFVVQYYGNTTASFTLQDDGQDGTDLTLIDKGVSPHDRMEFIAGWVSVLMALKAAVDFGVDLRTHDLMRNWYSGFVEN